MTYQEALAMLRAGGNPLATWGLSDHDCGRYRYLTALLNVSVAGLEVPLYSRRRKAGPGRLR